MRKLWNWVKAYFSQSEIVQPKGATIEGVKWSLYTVDHLDDQLRVSEQAGQLGSNCQPKPSQMRPDPVESQIEGELQQRVNDDRAAANDKVNSLNVSVLGAQINTIRGKIALEDSSLEKNRRMAIETLQNNQERELAAIEPEHQHEVEILERDHQADIQQLDQEQEKQKDQLPDLHEAIEDYRQQYGVKRMPQIVDKDTRKAAAILVLLFAVVQVVMNAVLFRPLTPEGIILALFYASLFAGVDLGFQFVFGQQASCLQAPDRWAKVRGCVGILVFAPVAIVINLIVVHVRRTASVYPGTGIEHWRTSFDTGVSDLDPIAWLLLLGGLGCSLLAFMKGWQWNEHIPCFLKNQTRINEIHEELQGIEDNRAQAEIDYMEDKSAMQKEHIQVLQRLKARHVADLGGKAQDFVDSRIKQLHDHEKDAAIQVEKIAIRLGTVNNIENILSGQEVLAKQAYQALVGRYRLKNQGARDQVDGCGEAPAYFSEPVSLVLQERPNYNDENSEAYVEAQRQYQQIQRMVETYTADITEVLPQMQQQWMEEFMNQGTEEAPAPQEEAPTYILDENFFVEEEEDGGDEE